MIKIFTASLVLLMAQMPSAFAQKTTTTTTLAAVESITEKTGQQVVKAYAQLVHDDYAEALKEVETLHSMIVDFTKKPTEEGLQGLKDQWKKARLIYSQTEAFRFYGGPIDEADKGPEGLLNAWPVDEAYLDYVEGKPEAGIINDAKKYPKITKKLLADLNEKDGERNISTGYHAVEFLLWGQDQTGQLGGKRPLTDYTTGKNADRRKTALIAMSELMIDHLKQVHKEWLPGKKNYRQTFEKMALKESVQKILLGLATLSADEMAGERMTVPLELKDPENEQDCFSDFTLDDYRANQVGIIKIFEGKNADGVKLVIAEKNPKLAEEISKALKDSLRGIDKIPSPLDEVITGKRGPKAQKQARDVVDLLQKQARLISQGAKIYGLELNVQEE